MKKYILCKCGFVLLLLGVLIIGSYKLNSRLFAKYGYESSDTTEILITGSSLVTLGLNPDLIPKSENIGLAAEPIVVSFFKLRDILNKKSTSIKKVVISCSLQELVNQDKVFTKNKPMVVEMFTRLSFLNKTITPNDLKGFDVDYFSYLEVFVRNRIFPNYAFYSRWYGNDSDSYEKENLLHIGGFQRSSAFNQRQTTQRKMDPKKYAQRHFSESCFKLNISSVNYGYLDSIANLCHKRNIELVAIGMPVSSELYDEIPACYKSYYYEKLSAFNMLPQCSFLDFSCSGKTEWFSDLVHLNEKGASVFSLKVSDLLYQ